MGQKMAGGRFAESPALFTDVLRFRTGYYVLNGHTGCDDYSVSEIITVIKRHTNHQQALNWKIYNNSFVNIKGRASISMDSLDLSTIEAANNYW